MMYYFSVFKTLSTSMRCKLPRLVFTSLIFPLSLVIHASALASETGLCGMTYGSEADARLIDSAMLFGSKADVSLAIHRAKETRGHRVGCSSTPVERTTPNNDPVPISDITETWASIHAHNINNLSDHQVNGCPALGRQTPALAFAALYALLAGYSVDMAKVRAIVDNTLATQNINQHLRHPLPSTPPWHSHPPRGVYGLAVSFGWPIPNTDADNNPCYQGGVVAEKVQQWCRHYPGFCPSYDNGKWQGSRFLLADIVVSSGGEDLIGDGGLAYDHGWAASMMVEAGLYYYRHYDIQHYLSSAFAAGNWSAKEPPVRNHNYTSKNIWLLAQLYALSSGLNNNSARTNELRHALIDKLERNLLPGVLMDLDRNGFVDGMLNMRFSSLHEIAKYPGRMWDGHNSLAEYQAMNAFALVEAYVAFRDTGGTGENHTIANYLRPYVFAMLDNLAREINHLGPPAAVEALHPIAFALLSGLWKVALYENDPQPAWEKAARVVWNSGYPQRNGYRIASNAALYLLVATQTPYTPLNQRIQ